MKKIAKLLFSAFVVFCALSVLNITSVSALDLKQESLTLVDKSTTVVVHGDGVGELSVSPKIEFNQLDDYITYKLVLNNNDGKKFKIVNISDNNSNTSIKISYVYSTDFNKNNKEIFITLRYIRYAKNINLSPISTTISLIDEDGNAAQTVIEDNLVTPNTGHNLSAESQTSFYSNYTWIFIVSGGIILYMIFCSYVNHSRRIKEKVRIKNTTGAILVLILIPGATAIVNAITPENVNFAIDLGDVVINDSYLMVQNEWDNPAKTYGKAIAKDSFEKIIVVDHKNIPASAIDSWDVSESKNGAVMAWYTDDDNNGLYELYLGQYGGVKANPMSYCAFYQFGKVNYIDVSKFDTSHATMLNYMFGDTGSQDTSGTFEIVGLANWDTSSVTDMSSAFNTTGALATAWKIGDLSKWNTSKVTAFNGMFAYAGQNATTWSISGLPGWKVDNVVEMGKMFLQAGMNADTFALGDLSGWNLAKATHMHGLFAEAGKNAGTWKSIGALNIHSVKYMQEMFLNCPQAKAVLNIYKSPNNYTQAFDGAATALGAEITVNYSSDVTDIDNIIMAKSPDANIKKGSLLP